MMLFTVIFMYLILRLTLLFLCCNYELCTGTFTNRSSSLQDFSGADPSKSQLRRNEVSFDE